jgi:hypothetical protein
MIGISCVIIANFLWGYATLSPIAETALKSDANAFDKVEMWREIGQQLDDGIDGI